MSYRPYFVSKVKRSFHADFLPQVIILALIVASIYSAVHLLDKESTFQNRIETTVSAATTLSLVMAAFNIHLTYDQSKLNKSSQYIEEWYMPQLDEHIAVLRKIVKEEYHDFLCEIIPNFDGKVYPLLSLKTAKIDLRNSQDHLEKAKSMQLLDKDDTMSGKKLIQTIRKNVSKRLNGSASKGLDEERSVKKVFSFLEHMSMDINYNVANKEYIKDYLGPAMVLYYEVFKDFIDSLHPKQNNNDIYINFICVAQSLEKRRHQSELMPSEVIAHAVE